MSAVEKPTLQKTIDGIQKLHERAKNDPGFASTLKNWPPTEQSSFFDGIRFLFQWQPIPDREPDNFYLDKPQKIEDPRVPFKGTNEEFDFLLKCLIERKEMETENLKLKEELEKQRYMHLDTIHELIRLNPATSDENYLRGCRLREVVHDGIMERLKKENSKLREKLEEYKWTTDSKTFINQLETQLKQANRQVEMMAEHQKNEILRVELDHDEEIKEMCYRMDKSDKKMRTIEEKKESVTVENEKLKIENEEILEKLKALEMEMEQLKSKDSKDSDDLLKEENVDEDSDGWSQMENHDGEKNEVD